LFLAIKKRSRRTHAVPPPLTCGLILFLCVGLGSCDIFDPSLSEGGLTSEEAYNAGYDDGYFDATNDFGYNGFGFGNPDPDSEFFFYDAGYDDGFEDGGGTIPGGGGGGGGSSDSVSRTLPGGGPFLMDVRVTSSVGRSAIATIRIDGRVVAQAEFGTTYCTFERCRNFGPTHSAGTDIEISVSSGSLIAPSSILVFDTSTRETTMLFSVSP